MISARRLGKSARTSLRLGTLVLGLSAVPGAEALEEQAAEKRALEA